MARQGTKCDGDFSGICVSDGGGGDGAGPSISNGRGGTPSTSASHPSLAQVALKGCYCSASSSDGDCEDWSTTPDGKLVKHVLEQGQGGSPFAVDLEIITKTSQQRRPRASSGEDATASNTRSNSSNNVNKGFAGEAGLGVNNAYSLHYVLAGHGHICDGEADREEGDDKAWTSSPASGRKPQQEVSCGDFVILAPKMPSHDHVLYSADPGDNPLVLLTIMVPITGVLEKLISSEQAKDIVDAQASADKQVSDTTTTGA